ncbi:flagellar export protein FliJ [Pseudoalteromonas denitrificans]|jgi:flagellar FliJ protein|uniref:Flagellar FliJ protein n=1 Tax=Pseudoalteromonas denitrificans DSM 6059 TaxID=1123010 RepID=A0A1I1HJ32_9GAMM|nr:flagellar export protein FliJ [Pseudoalteromonas denitrificans]SFC23572.1 flagellar FliJ protein [Pseudoalteromonas denitrificans DSM 6059]
MALKQLELVLKITNDKEEKLRMEYLKSQQYLIENREKLTGLSEFRFDYMKQLQLKGEAGLSGANYSHFQSFITKIENAMDQQVQVINTAKQVVAQRQEIWLEQQMKAKAIEKLIAKKQALKTAKLNKAEQIDLDELTTNQFIQRQRQL